MAATEFGTNDPQAVKRWSARLTREAIGETFFKRLAGTDESSCIQIHKDLETQPGDTIYYDLLTQDRSPGVQGDANLEDFESPLVFHQDTIHIDQLRNAVLRRGMSQQRTLHNLRNSAKDVLVPWYSRTYDGQLFSYLAGTSGNGEESGGLWEQLNGTSGIAVATDPGFAGNTLNAADSDHFIGGPTTGVFTLQAIDIAKNRAKTLNPMIRPIMVKGKPKYVVVLHPNQVYNLRTGSGANQWLEIHKAIDERGTDSPIYSGALGEYNGCVIHESEFIPRLDDAADGYARYTQNGGGSDDLTFGLFLGAQAASFAMGNAYGKPQQGRVGGGGYFSWVENDRDYGNKLGIGVAACYGVKEVTYDSKRFGSIVIATEDPAPTL